MLYGTEKIPAAGGERVMTTTQSIITIVAVVLGTMVTRFLPFLIFPEGKDTACLYSVSGKGTSLCSDRSSRYLLLEGCASQFHLWIAGSYCDPVYHGTA